MVRGKTEHADKGRKILFSGEAHTQASINQLLNSLSASSNNNKRDINMKHNNMQETTHTGTKYKEDGKPACSTVAPGDLIHCLTDMV